MRTVHAPAALDAVDRAARAQHDALGLDRARALREEDEIELARRDVEEGLLRHFLDLLARIAVAAHHGPAVRVEVVLTEIEIVEVVGAAHALLDEPIGAAVIGDELDALRGDEHIVVPGAVEIGGVLRPAEGAQHLVARAEVGRADEGIAVDVEIRAFRRFAPAAAHAVVAREGAVRAHQIVVVLLRPLAVFEDVDALMVADDAAFNGAARDVRAVKFFKGAALLDPIGVGSAVLSSAGGGVELDEVQPEAVGSVDEIELAALRFEDLRVDAVGGAPACGRAEKERIEPEGARGGLRLREADARLGAAEVTREAEVQPEFAVRASHDVGRPEGHGAVAAGADAVADFALRGHAPIVGGLQIAHALLVAGCGALHFKRRADILPVEKVGTRADLIAVGRAEGIRRVGVIGALPFEDGRVVRAAFLPGRIVGRAHFKLVEAWVFRVDQCHRVLLLRAADGHGAVIVIHYYYRTLCAVFQGKRESFFVFFAGERDNSFRRAPAKAGARHLPLI